MHDISGKNVAVIGCGSSAIGKGLGEQIDACDYVIRANRAYLTQGIESDYGTRTDYLVIGNIPVMSLFLKGDLTFDIYPSGCGWWEHLPAFKMAWDKLQVRHPTKCKIFPKSDYLKAWKYPRRPLAGTCAAVMADFYKPASLLIIGIDNYEDITVRRTVFRNYNAGLPSIPNFDINIDKQALNNLSCKNITWHK